MKSINIFILAVMGVARAGAFAQSLAFLDNRGFSLESIPYE